MNDTFTNSDQFNDDVENTPEYRWPTDLDSRKRRVEAVLLMARKPLNSRKISQLAELEDGTQARTLIKQINTAYDQKQRAFHIKRVAGGYQMRTRPQFSDWLRRLDHIPAHTRLSTPALETLTVVAYRQPIIKADIEAVRGVSCGEMLRQLLEKGLIKIAGRSENLGRPFLYATTKDFLTQFGLNTLNELPRSKQLSGKGLPQWATSDENHAPDTREMLSVESSFSKPQPDNHPNDPSDDGSPQEEAE
ncbi:MAG: SMC-Scp complex subunit ScpB [Planctomycetota bacterium]